MPMVQTRHPLGKLPWILQTLPSIFLTLFWPIEEEWIDGP